MHAPNPAPTTENKNQQKHITPHRPGVGEADNIGVSCRLRFMGVKGASLLRRICSRASLFGASPERPASQGLCIATVVSRRHLCRSPGEHCSSKLWVFCDLAWLDAGGSSCDQNTFRPHGLKPASMGYLMMRLPSNSSQPMLQHRREAAFPTQAMSVHTRATPSSPVALNLMAAFGHLCSYRVTRLNPHLCALGRASYLLSQDMRSRRQVGAMLQEHCIPLGSA